MNKYDLIHSFKAMLLVAKQYDLDIDEKYEALHDQLIEDYELDVTDMMDSLEKIYNQLKGNEYAIK